MLKTIYEASASIILLSHNDFAEIRRETNSIAMFGLSYVFVVFSVFFFKFVTAQTTTAVTHFADGCNRVGLSATNMRQLLN